ncbi:hypothetical protein OJ997_32085 [Solirubrobacter phytolaccae]|uniref:Uncharacterized protein n=1 Tax=Solirubrobacter phytolaccae TaxID=1404360 RepID=A0A9X3NED2_9ACTN|nr:hypothetical protein [Solirubrobacter phytolaccae]MDA0184988.1 hypothetical protein [Solirubrobacter phytolaccae]
MKWILPLGLAVLVAGCGGSSSGPAASTTPAATAARTPAPPALCDGELPVRKLGRAQNPAVTELSGLARTRQGTFWTHNDSGDSARVFELGKTGALVREVQVTGAEAVDWEDIAIRGRTLYAGDIGDNLGQRKEIVVYEFAIPEGGTAVATRIALTYPDRPHDAEALLVDPRTGQLAIVTKNLGGVADVYTATKSGPLKKAATVELGIGQAITSGDVSADGRTVVLRSYDSAFVWRKTRKESLATAFKRDRECTVGADLLDEGQGESIALSRNGRAFYTLPEGANPTLRRYGG